MSGTPNNSAGRSCGACTVCCYAAAIVALQKPCGVRCTHLTDQGCGVYAQRAADAKYQECIKFECMWLQGWGEVEDRPDKIGVMFVNKNDPNAPGKTMVHAIESHMFGSLNPRAKALINKTLAEGRMVVVQNWKFSIAMEPNGDSWQYVIDPADPLRSRVDPKVRPVQLTARGRPVDPAAQA